MAYSRLWGVTALTVSIFAGCFSHPINRAPVVVKIDSNGSVVRGQSASFEATVTDADQDNVEVTWALVAGDSCPNPDAVTWPPGTATPAPAKPDTFAATAEQTTSNFCLWAFATDPHGAKDANNNLFRPSAPDNGAPTAAITVTAPVPADIGRLYQKYRLVGSGSDPEDDPLLAPQWSFSTNAVGSLASLEPCDDAPNDDYVRCFTADLPGDYTVSLVVQSQSSFKTSPDKSPPATKTLVIQPDAPPCIQMTTPPRDITFVSYDPAVDHTFSVDMVDDDGDPYPPRDLNQNQMLRYTWYFGKTPDAQTVVSDAQLTVADGNFRRFVVKAEDNLFQEGDFGVVRVEIRDRRPEALDELVSCDKNICSTSPTCFQRVTWTILWL